MKLAVIKTGGKQYVVKENDIIKVEKIKDQKDGQAEFEVLLTADGDQVELGAPILKATVAGQIVKEGRSRKVTGVKYKPKTREHTKYGHRQAFVEVKIGKI